MNVVFRTDASQTIGTGHVMRCLTLATALRKRGATVIFICREHNGHICDLIEQNKFSVYRMSLPDSASPNTDTVAHAAWLGTSWSSDAEETLTVIRALDTKPDWLVVDHYALDMRWEQALRASVGRIMAIDDLADREHDCDLLLDQNLVARPRTRYNGKLPSACGKLLGPGYALLQPDYAELHERVPPRAGPIRRILIFFGGVDNDNLTGRALAAFLKLGRPDIEVDVVLATKAPHFAEVRTQAAGHDNVHLHSSLPSLAPLMVKADLAVGGSGATSWERLCMGLPAIVITLAENQRPIAEELNRRGLVRWLGHSNAISRPAIENALETLIRQDQSEDWSRQCLATVDGEGTRRVCAALITTSVSSLRARHTRLADQANFLDWSDDHPENDADHPEPKHASDARNRFSERLRNPDRFGCYVVETADAVALGAVCFESVRSGWEIDCAIDPVFRNRELERPVLQTAIRKFRSDMTGRLTFSQATEACTNFGNVSASPPVRPPGGKATWEISVCSDNDSWINESVSELVRAWLTQGHRVTWVNDASTLPSGDICFYLSYGRIVDADILSRHRNNLVVHASELPKGRGWSPLTWQILEGRNEIPVSLFEAGESVDSGPVYKTAKIEFSGTELVGELRAAVARATVELCQYFVDGYPAASATGIPQTGEPSYYERRRPKDSQLNIDRSLREQFNMLRTVDGEHYPAWFELNDRRFALKIEALDKSPTVKISAK